MSYSFIRKPTDAILNYADLTLGQVVWHVYGIYPPCGPTSYTITRLPSKHSEHPEYSDIHVSQADSIVFDWKRGDGDHSLMHFASDCNMLPGYSHNNNYCFATKEAAEDFVKSCCEDWNSNPDQIERIEEQRRLDAMADAYDNAYYDDYDLFGRAVEGL
jgi:hypothetical protein